MHAATATPLLAGHDTTRRFVRLHGPVGATHVAFGFGVSSADLMVDLVLPRAAYEEFCRVNEVEFLTEEEARVVDADREKWAFGTPGQIERAREGSQR